MIKIPDFLSRVDENSDNRILVYYGDYKIDNIYEMNDFLSNRDINFYKLQQVISSGKKNILRNRYIVLSDIYFLLFDPVPDNLSYGKLLFWGDIRQLSSSKGSQDYNNHLILEWKNQEQTVISFELVFDYPSVKDFLEISLRKINKLKDTFSIFHDELTKPNNEKKSYDYDKLILLIKFKEDILEKQNSPNTVRELISLYQSVIEVLSERNDDSYTIYLSKMKNMLEKQDKLKDEEQEVHGSSSTINERKTSNVSSDGNDIKKLNSFELSGAYYSVPHEDDKIMNKK